MKLNPKIIGVAVVLLVILIGLGVMVFGKNKKPETKEEGKVAVNKPLAPKTNSLLDIISMGKTQKCDFSYKAASGASTNGTIYISGTKMRGNITTTTAANKVSNINMIRDNQTTYVWGSDLPTGIKMTVSLDALKSNTQANQYFNTNQKTDFKCQAWSVDTSLFAVPTNIKFTDVSAFQNMGKISPAETQAAGQTVNPQCSACNSLPPDAKTVCLTQLHCQ